MRNAPAAAKPRQSIAILVDTDGAPVLVGEPEDRAAPPAEVVQAIREAPFPATE